MFNIRVSIKETLDALLIAEMLDKEKEMWLEKLRGMVVNPLTKEQISQKLSKLFVTSVPIFALIYFSLDFFPSCELWKMFFSPLYLFMGVMTFIPLLIATWIVLIVKNYFLKKKKKEVVKDELFIIEQLKLVSESKETLNRFLLHSEVPMKYHDVGVIGKIMDLLNAKKAKSVKEAIYLYEQNNY